jgi:chromosome segregation ATPase
MANWLTGIRDRGRRIEALEHAVNSLTDRVSDLADVLSPAAARLEQDRDEFASMRTSALAVMAAEAERAQELSGVVRGLGEQVDALESAAVPQAVSSLEQRVDEVREDISKLRTALRRVERQLELHAEEFQRTNSALLERVELLRRSVPSALATPKPLPDSSARRSAGDPARKRQKVAGGVAPER